MKYTAIIVALFAAGALSAPAVTFTDAHDAKDLAISPYRNFVDAADPAKVLGEK
ncbi:hypothetical protein HD806DRAFT_534902 [Xylariaceae sp. AK1471]|nr:hypothetical protein HD806DRAFT_534902 [Xylariaceae sp. AK1471]